MEFFIPVHAAQGQINIWILEEHPRKKVPLFRMNQEWCIYDLHK